MGDYTREIRVGNSLPPYTISERAERISRWEGRPEEQVFDELMRREVRLIDNETVAQDIGPLAVEKAA